MPYAEKVYDEYQILYHKFQIPVHIELLLKIIFFPYCSYISKQPWLSREKRCVVIAVYLTPCMEL